MKKKHHKKQPDSPPKSQHELHHAHIRKSKKLKRTALLMNILFVVTAVYSILALYLFFTGTSKPGINSIRQNIGVVSDTSNLQTIHSSSGFSITYATNLLSAQGIVNSANLVNPNLFANGSGAATSFVGTNLNEKRFYSTVNFWASNSTTTPRTAQTLPEMILKTSIKKNIFSEGRQQYGQSLSDIDVAIKLYAPSVITKSYTTITPTLTSTSDITISNLHYKKLIYSMKDTVFPTSSYSQVQYATIQNGRPYIFDQRITNLTPAGDVTLLNQVIRATHYTKVDSNNLASNDNKNSSYSLASAAAIIAPSLPQDSIHLPIALDYNALKIVADNQPAVVRVASISCYDFNLLLPGGSVSYSVHDACEGIVGSGSIISNDGYISTNGHVVEINPSAAFQEYINLSVSNGNTQALKDYLHYLINSNIATKAQLTSLINAINSGDNTAIQTLLNLTSNIPLTDYQVTAKHVSYGVQLSNNPMRVVASGTHLNFMYLSTIVPAKLIGDNYDASRNIADKVDFGTYSGTDVALIKIDGKNFPLISLGKSATIHESDQVLAVGWPGFVDGGLDTNKAFTIPTATTGSVVSIQKEVAGLYRVIITDTPIAEGNSGGPAFNNLGDQIGLTTYAVSSADPNSGVTKESSGGILRTVDDIQGLITKYNVHLKTNSQVNTLWNNVIADFTVGHFKHAAILTTQVKKLYPSDYLATSFQLAAQQQIKAGHDTSSPKLALIIGAIVAVVLFIGSLIVAIIYIRHHKHGKKMGYNLPPAMPYDPNAQNVQQPINTPPAISPPSQQNQPINNQQIPPQIPRENIDPNGPPQPQPPQN